MQHILWMVGVYMRFIQIGNAPFRVVKVSGPKHTMFLGPILSSALMCPVLTNIISSIAPFENYLIHVRGLPYMIGTLIEVPGLDILQKIAPRLFVNLVEHHPQPCFSFLASRGLSAVLVTMRSSHKLSIEPTHDTSTIGFFDTGMSSPLQL